MSSVGEPFVGPMRMSIVGAGNLSPCLVPYAVLLWSRCTIPTIQTHSAWNGSALSTTWHGT